MPEFSSACIIHALSLSLSALCVTVTQNTAVTSVGAPLLFGASTAFRKMKCDPAAAVIANWHQLILLIDMRPASAESACAKHSRERETAAAQISLTRALCFCSLSHAMARAACVYVCDEIINGCANSELLCVHRQLFLRVLYNENKSQGSARQICRRRCFFFTRFASRRVYTDNELPAELHATLKSF